MIHDSDSADVVHDWKSSTTLPPRGRSCFAFLADRIETLIQQRRVAGILDRQNGTFIYVSDAELEKLAESILERKGPITGQDVATLCRNLLFPSSSSSPPTPPSTL
jgi:hypothetical protein